MIIVNGIKIFSDKQISRIVDTRAEFSDGSWCDVNTKQVVNRGKGYITIGAMTGNENSEKITTEEQIFLASNVEVRKVDADVTIEVNDDEKSKKISVTISGRENQIKKIGINKKNDALVIQGFCNDGSSQSASTIISQRSISIGGGNIKIGSSCGQNIVVVGNKSDNPCDVKILVKVPKGTPITTSQIGGQTIIGDIESPINISADTNDIKVGSVTDAIINSMGDSDIEVREISGNLNVNLTGSGKVKIKNGYSPNTVIYLVGSGRVYFRGKAKNAIVSVTGSGNVQLSYVENRPVINITGSGDIDADNWENIKQ